MSAGKDRRVVTVGDGCRIGMGVVLLIMFVVLSMDSCAPSVRKLSSEVKVWGKPLTMQERILLNDLLKEIRRAQQKAVTMQERIMLNQLLKEISEEFERVGLLR